MIDVTDEMMTAYREAVRGGGDSTDDIRRSAIQAVLAIVERDLPNVDAVSRRAYEQGMKDERALKLMGF